MTDTEAIAVVSKILHRARAGEFGCVGGLAPAIHVGFGPFRVQIGNLLLSRPRAVAVADGRLRVDARTLGWVFEPRDLREKIRRGAGVKEAVSRRIRRKPAAKQTQEERRAEYLREVGRDTIFRKEA